MPPYSRCTGGQSTPFSEHFKNIREQKEYEGCGLGLGHQAARIIAPVPIEPDQAPLDTPADAEPAGRLQNGVMHGVLGAVRNVSDAVAKAARDGLRRAPPGAECRLADAVDAEDREVGIPVLVFFLIE